jgi:hypothetical protein
MPACTARPGSPAHDPGSVLRPRYNSGSFGPRTLSYAYCPMGSAGTCVTGWQRPQRGAAGAQSQRALGPSASFSPIDICL